MLPVFSSSFFDYNVKSLIGHSKPVLKTPKEPKAIESKDRSPVSISIGDNVTTLANTSITITCPTTGIPKPVVTWTKDGREISVGERYTVQNDGSLLISKADEEDDARYTCTADSVAGKDSATSVVKVVGELLKTSASDFFNLVLLLVDLSSKIGLLAISVQRLSSHCRFYSTTSRTIYWPSSAGCFYFL